MRLAWTRRVRIHTAWMMALVLAVTLLMCHMALGQLHRMTAGHDSMAPVTQPISPEPAGVSLTVADYFAVLLVAVLGTLAWARTVSLKTRRAATNPLRGAPAAVLSGAPRPCLQRARPAFHGVFRL